jgi:replicative DNA helicase
MRVVEVPANDEAEDALIGSILIAPEYFRECNAILSGADDFRQHHWKHVWKAFVDLDKQEKPIDSLTVMDQIVRAGAMVDALDLVKAMNEVPTTRNSPEYARQTAEMAGRRRLAEYCSTVHRLALDPSTAFLDGLEKARKHLDEIPVMGESKRDLTAQLSEFYDDLDNRRKNPMKINGIPIGVKKIDEETGGQQRGELTIIAGQPKVGKSMFAGQVAYHGSTQGFQCGIYSLEMRAKQILRRQIATLTGVNTKSMRSGFISDGEWDSIVHASSEMSRLSLYIVDDSSLTLEQIRADIYTRSRVKKVDLVIVDYIGLINDPEKDDNVRENNITKGLKRIADQEDVAIIAIHSMNKEGLDKVVPKLSSVSGPVKNVYNADNIVFFLEHIPEAGFHSNPNMRTLYFKAMRDAPGLHYVHLQRIFNRPGFEAVPDMPLPQEPDYEWQKLDN